MLNPGTAKAQLRLSGQSPPNPATLIYLPKFSTNRGRSRGRGEWPAPSTHCSVALHGPRGHAQQERGKPGSTGQARTGPAPGQPGRRRGRKKTQALHSHGLAPSSQPWRLAEGKSRVFAVVSRRFAALSSTWQMPVGMIALPRESQLHPIRAVAGCSTAQVPLCSPATKATLQWGPAAQDRVQLSQHLLPCGLEALGRQEQPAQSAAGQG